MGDAAEVSRSTGVGQLLLVYCALMGLLGATIIADRLALGPWHTFAGLGIAAAKATLVMTWFMHYPRENAIARFAGIVGVVWVAFGLAGVLTDNLSRGWATTPPSAAEQDIEIRGFDRVRFPDFSPPRVPFAD